MGEGGSCSTKVLGKLCRASFLLQIYKVSGRALTRNLGSGGRRVVQYEGAGKLLPGVLLIWIMLRKEPFVLAVGAGWG